MLPVLRVLWPPRPPSASLFVPASTKKWACGPKLRWSRYNIRSKRKTAPSHDGSAFICKHAPENDKQNQLLVHDTKRSRAREARGNCTRFVAVPATSCTRLQVLNGDYTSRPGHLLCRTPVSFTSFGPPG